MEQVDLLITPRWLVPVDGAQSILENHAVAVDKGKIVAIGSKELITEKFFANHHVELPNHILTPGFINAHTHAAMNLFRGYADDLPLMEWLSEHIWPLEEKWIDENFVSTGTDLACAEMLKSGTTCFNDMYFFPDIVAKRANKAGIRACVGMIVLDFPTVWAQNADEYIQKGLEVRDHVRHSPLITTAFAPHAPYTVSDGPLEKIAILSEELECPVHIHLHETAHEIEESTARYGVRPLERLGQTGLLGPKLVAVHMTQLLAGEIETLSERGVHIVHCPESNLKLASGFCPVDDLQKANINVCIGTDSATSNNDLDMLSEMRTASLLAKGVANSPTAMDAYCALEAATLSGARALGLEKITGSIEVGKMADLCATDFSDISTQPVFNPVSQLIYNSNRNQISDVWVAGEQRLSAGELTSMDESALTAKAKEWGEKIGSTRKLK